MALTGIARIKDGIENYRAIVRSVNVHENTGDAEKLRFMMSKCRELHAELSSVVDNYEFHDGIPEFEECDNLVRGIQGDIECCEELVQAIDAIPEQEFQKKNSMFMCLGHNYMAAMAQVEELVVMCS